MKLQAIHIAYTVYGCIYYDDVRMHVRILMHVRIYITCPELFLGRTLVCSYVVGLHVGTLACTVGPA